MTKLVSNLSYIRAALLLMNKSHDSKGRFAGGGVGKGVATVTKQHSNADEVKSSAAQVSKGNTRHWATHVEPYGGKTHHTAYANRVDIPRQHIELGKHYGVAHKGKVTPYSASELKKGHGPTDKGHADGAEESRNPNKAVAKWFKGRGKALKRRLGE